MIGEPGGKTMRVLKFVLVALLILVGVVFVYDGMGFEYHIFNHDLVLKYGIPFGIALIIVGTVLARYWDVSSDLN
jgi:uncharacterized membrane protein